MRKLPTGATFAINPAPIEVLPSLPAQSPQSPVHARVYVLTDYGCASACLSFVDEMMRFPGVRQIGTETFIHRRSGGVADRWTFFPVGPASSGWGRMLRENRKRGEDQPWVPTYKFDGNIEDSMAVERWVNEVVLEQDRARSPSDQ